MSDSEAEPKARPPSRTLDPRIEHLLSTTTIRSQARRMMDRALAGHTHFEPRLDKLSSCADLVVETIRATYPDLEIPFHSRWGHFRAGGVDRVRSIDTKLAHLSPRDRVRAKIDLVVVSVLLDAGAGMKWRFRDGAKDPAYSKSEGLALASLAMFSSGAFSSDPKAPLQVDSKGLRELSANDLARGFQVSDENPLIGLEGRLALLHSVAAALERNESFFGNARASGPRRIGDLLQWYEREAAGAPLPADRILRGIQLGLSSIWPGRLEINGFNLGDVWRYEPFGADLVPFHKLPQWLSYSLIEPLEEFGIAITEPDRLTGLAEYRNGGLFLDTGVLQLREPSAAASPHSPGSELVVEWRALTVDLLEKLAEQVRTKLGLTQAEFPLGKVLEGGTWAAGRRIAARLRADGGPPLRIESDGTVF